MSQEQDEFPSSLHGDENSSISSVSQPNQRRQVKRRITAQKLRKEDEEEESLFQDEDGSDDFEGKGKRGTQKKVNQNAGIQHKVISKKAVTKNVEQKFKKSQGVTATTPATTFLYKPGVLLPSLAPYLNCLIEIRIPIESINKKNPAIIKRLVWGGGGVYSSHSDPVAMGVHNGMLSFSDSKITQKIYEGVSLICKVLRGKKLNGSYKAHILSRSLKAQCAHCLKPERTQWLMNLGSQEQLLQWAKKMCLPVFKRQTKLQYMSIMNYESQQTQPVTMQEALMNKLIPPLNEGWIVWDMCNEPSQKFNVITFMDRHTNQGFKSNTSYKLRTHVLFIETKARKYFYLSLKIIRFEIYMEESMRIEDVFLESSIYSIAEVNEPLKVDIEFMQTVGLPLPLSQKKELFKNLRWDEFIWGSDCLTIPSREFIVEGLQCFKLMSLKNSTKSQQNQ